MADELYSECLPGTLSDPLGIMFRALSGEPTVAPDELNVAFEFATEALGKYLDRTHR